MVQAGVKLSEKSWTHRSLRYLHVSVFNEKKMKNVTISDSLFKCSQKDPFVTERKSKSQSELEESDAMCLVGLEGRCIL